MIFAMAQLPGEFTRFNFPANVPAPFNFLWAIATNQKMLTWPEKIQVAPPLIPMLLGGQDYIDKQDEYSVSDWMLEKGLPPRINDEVFIAMAKALDFIDPDKLSMTVILTAMNRFLNETNGLQMAFLDGNQPERLCAPMREYIEARGGKVHLNAPFRKFELNADGSVSGLKMAGKDGQVRTGPAGAEEPPPRHTCQVHAALSQRSGAQGWSWRLAFQSSVSLVSPLTIQHPSLPFLCPAPATGGRGRHR